MITDPVELFSQTVPESHARFLEVAADLGVEVFTHPLTGPAGEPLQTAVARLGSATARNVILCISGIHGLEGFAGSALQVGALRARAALLDLGPDMAIVFVHQLNPWGAAWGRKENESNQELLRHIYHLHRPRSPNPVFAALADVMDYPSIRTVDEFMAARSRARLLADRFTPEQIGVGLIPGQDTHPTLFTYNGGPKAWSADVLETVVRTHVAGAEVRVPAPRVHAFGLPCTWTI